MVDRGIRDIVFSSTCRHVRRAGQGADRRGPSAKAGQPVRRVEARGRANPALVRSGRTTFATRRCVTSMPPAPTPTARSAKITIRSRTSFRWRSAPRSASTPSAQSLRNRLPDARRDGDSRLHPRRRSGRGASARAGASSEGREGACAEPRHRQGSLGSRGRGIDREGQRAQGSARGSRKACGRLRRRSSPTRAKARCRASDGGRNTRSSIPSSSTRFAGKSGTPQSRRPAILANGWPRSPGWPVSETRLVGTSTVEVVGGVPVLVAAVPVGAATAGAVIVAARVVIEAVLRVLRHEGPASAAT